LYIVSACIGIGLAPVQGAYVQPVALEQATISPQGTELVVSGPGGSRRFGYPHGFLPNAGVEAAEEVAGPATYVGTADDVVTGRAGSPDLRGAIAVISGPLSDAADDTLRARGAAVALQLTGDEAQYSMYLRSRGNTRMRLADTTIPRSLGAALPSLVASPDLSRRLLPGPPSARERLPDSITVRLNVDRRPVRSDNVACLLEGSDLRAKDTAIAYTAHYDHLGIGPADSRGDSIYNGFSDNAAGVAMVLAIGEALARRSPARPRHSVLLLFFTGEEQGLLGSDYYVAKPLWPLARLRGVINLDAGAPPGRPWSWRIAGGQGNSLLGRLAQDVAAERGWSATTSPATPNSDYFPFARSGVPAIFVVPGTAPYQGLSVDSSQALRRKWDHYHEPADEWVPDFPFAGLGRYAEYAFWIGRALDGSSPAEQRRERPMMP
ncbi:MAG: M28 family peptidase, partial [Gemmatimonadetes bacterium]|nr:M28 family peptidase [Gemmatimonadota bacterium]